MKLFPIIREAETFIESNANHRCFIPFLISLRSSLPLQALSIEHTLDDRVLRTDFYDPSARHNSSGDPGGGGSGAGGGGSGVGGGVAKDSGGGGSGRSSASAATARLHG